eukprot:3533803-Rhodomonas_salina.1
MMLQNQSSSKGFVRLRVGERGRGLFASKDLEAGEAMLKVPLTACIKVGKSLRARAHQTGILHLLKQPQPALSSPLSPICHREWHTRLRWLQIATCRRRSCR